MVRVKQGKPRTGKRIAKKPAIDPRILEMTPDQTAAYLERAEKVLPPEDFWIARGMAATTACVCAELKSKRASVRRLPPPTHALSGI